MSGVITPILDTLLHDVLGKRVDTQPARDIIEPVKPLSPGQAPRAVHSDARLNAERAGAALPQPGVGNAAGRPATPDVSPQAPSSTATHFSPAARNIADVLLKFPAPPSVVKPQAPLMSAGDSVNAPLLASRLQYSIESSGLFYESHVARWYRGDMLRSALEREPQMLLHSLRLPAARPQAAEDAGARAPALGRAVFMPAPAGGAPLAPLAPGPLAGAPASGVGPAQASTVAAAQADMPVESSRMAQPANLEVADETLQGIVRHQLELLVTPTLRWEGDVWSGIFMALAIHVPEELGEHGSGEGRERGEDEDPVWYSHLSLELPALGELDVQLHLRTASLSLTLQSESQACVDALGEGRDALTERLQGCGFDEVRISVLARTDETGRHEA